MFVISTTLYQLQNCTSPAKQQVTENLLRSWQSLSWSTNATCFVPSLSLFQQYNSPLCSQFQSLPAVKLTTLFSVSSLSQQYNSPPCYHFQSLPAVQLTTLFPVSSLSQRYNSPPVPSFQSLPAVQLTTLFPVSSLSQQYNSPPCSQFPVSPSSTTHHAVPNFQSLPAVQLTTLFPVSILSQQYNSLSHIYPPHKTLNARCQLTAASLLFLFQATTLQSISTVLFLYII